MLPRALLFSSDEQTSRLLGDALAEAQFETEHCSEILPAVEQLTKGIFQIVLTDWDQPFEAGFLLKTARELRTTESILAIAIVHPHDASTALRAGANAVLTKPCTAEQVRNSLFAVRDLLTDDPAVADPAPVPETIRTALPQKFLPAELETDPVPDKPAPDPVTVRTPAVEFLPFEEREKQPAATRRILKTGVAAASFAAMVVFLFGAWRLGFLSPDSISYEVQVAQAPVVGDSSLEFKQWPLATSHAPAPSHVEVLPLPSEPATEASKPQSPFPTLPMPVHALPEPVEPGALPLIRPLFPVSGAHPQIPPSLAVPFPAMSAVSYPKLENLNTKWTVEPPLLSEEVTRALLVHEVKPVCPEQALHAGVQGTVVLQVWIAKDGTVRDAKLLRGPLAFGKAAFDAVRQWRYKPYLMNGQPVEVQTLITMDFRQP